MGDTESGTSRFVRRELGAVQRRPEACPVVLARDLLQCCVGKRASGRQRVGAHAPLSRAGIMYVRENASESATPSWPRNFSRRWHGPSVESGKAFQEYCRYLEQETDPGIGMRATKGGRCCGLEATYRRSSGSGDTSMSASLCKIERSTSGTSEVLWKEQQ
ncbi:hypothetical protein B0H14DRAFT_3691708 [Mycena olivaceomarginata]|nr:hypothetical protein B0H14DRAFT_3691708 [Mycena olivaceomarginata]